MAASVTWTGNRATRFMYIAAGTTKGVVRIYFFYLYFFLYFFVSGSNL
jgi:hypothetical protein